MRLVKLLKCLVFVGLWTISPVSASPLYNLTVFNEPLAMGVNNQGETLLFSSVYQAYGPNAGQVTSLSTYGDGPAFAFGINDLGQIAGVGNNGAFVTQGHTVVNIPTPPGYQYGQPSAVNDLGDVAVLEVSKTNTEAFVFHNGKMIDLGTPGSQYVFTSPSAINDLGEVTGSTYPTSSAEAHAFLYSNGKMIDIGTLGGQESGGAAINDLGQVVGSSTLGGNLANQTHAFLYSGGKMIDLGALSGPSGYSVAAGINNLGQIVGNSDGNAVLWESGKILNLNNLLTSPAPFTLTAATGINALGQISGEGYNSSTSTYYGFLLTPVGLPVPATPIEPVSQPVPEPSALLMFGSLALAPLLYRRWERRSSKNTANP